MTRKRPFDYRANWDKVKGFANFKIDGRKTNKTLTPQEKTRIRKAFREIGNLPPGHQFVKVNRKAGETAKQFDRRLEKLRNTYGQRGKQIKGLTVAAPPGAKIRREGNKITVENLNLGTRDIFVPFKKSSLDNDPLTLTDKLRRLLKRKSPDPENDIFITVVGRGFKMMGRRGLNLYLDGVFDLQDTYENIKDWMIGVIIRTKL